MCSSLQPPMSTYLVMVLVSSFENETSESGDTSTDVRVWARRDVIRFVEYIKGVAPRVLAFLNNYFGIFYPLSKMDLVALPDFPAGAMGTLFKILFCFKFFTIKIAL